jgi:amino acid adenylation domain-containing protein
MRLVEQFIQKLTLLGIALTPQEDKLHYDSPQQQIAPEFLELLREKKVDLLDYLNIPAFCAASHGQREVWMVDQQFPGNSASTASAAFHLSGRLNLSLFSSVIQLLINRHAALRTRFVWKNDTLMQQIVGYQPARLEEIEAMYWSHEQIQGALKALHERPFDLEQGPLFRVSLLHHGPEQHSLLFSVHHIVVDRGALYQLVDELWIFYQELQAGNSVDLPLIQQTYADYVIWQQKMLEQEETRLWQFWKTELAGELPVLQLPTDFPRPPQQSLHGIEAPIQISAELTAQLKKFAQKHGCTLYMLLLAAWQTLLHRHSGQEELLIGLPMIGQTGVQFEEVIGNFTSPVVMRTLFQGDPNFGEVLVQVKDRLSAVLDHREYPFARLVEQLHPRHDPGHSPIFQSTFVLQQPHRRPDLFFSSSPSALGDLQLAEISLPAAARQDDITLELFDSEGSLSGSLQGRADLFSAATLKRMGERFGVLLTAIVDPNFALDRQPVSQLPLLTAAERHQLLVEWNTTAADFGQEKCIHTLFEEQVERTPDAVAVIFEEAQLTYAELNARANQLAHTLQGLGVGPDVLVGLCVERSLEMVVGLLGILKAGGAYVPLDPKYPAERLAFMLEDAAVPVLLTQASLLGTLPVAETQLLCLDRDWPAVALNPTSNLHSPVQPHHLVYVLYTSGSTGKPKGALNHHRGLHNLLHDLQRIHRLTPADSTLQTTAFSFDVATAEMLWPLLYGARLILIRPDRPRDSTYLVTLLKQHGITTLHVVPTLLQLLLDEKEFMNLKTLRRVLAAGEALSFRLQQRFLLHPTATLHNWYGPTETTIYVTSWSCQNDSPPGIVPIGRPVANTQAYILDLHRQPTPIGVAGELHIGGVQVGYGYLNRPELTAERFIPNPFGPGWLYKTGDLARWLPEGILEYLGRIDYQVKIRGFRIELGEIEAALICHPLVHEVVVVARQNDAVPEDKRLVAYLVPTPQLPSPPQELPPLETTLRTYLAKQLPNYMIPTHFVVLPAMPLTPNGKINRLAFPAPPPQRPGLATQLVTPQTRIEQLIAKTWQETLRIELVGIHDNFFELGGNSLLLTQAYAKLLNEDEMDEQSTANISTTTLLEYPTIYTLAQFLSQHTANDGMHSRGQLAPEQTEAADKQNDRRSRRTELVERRVQRARR